MQRPFRLGFLIIFSFLLSVAVLGQSNILKGSVHDSHGQALPSVKVTVKETGTTVFTDAHGAFAVVIPSTGRLRIEFAARGYFPLTQTFDASHAPELTVSLTVAPVLLQEAHVTAQRLADTPLNESPASATVVAGDVLATMPRGVGAEEALSSVPGMKVDNQANQDRVHVSIRGQGILTERGIRGIGVLLDGLPLNDPSGFAPDLFDVGWTGVEEVHVVRGPVAFLYGGGSSGGVIDIATTTPGEVGHTTIVLNGGSNTFYKGYADYSGKLGSLPTYLSAARAEGDGYRVHTRFYGNNFYGKISFHPAQRLRLNVIGAGTAYFNQNPEGLNSDQVEQDPRQANPDSLKYNEYQKTKRISGGITGQFEISDSQRLSFTSYARRTHFDESVPSSVNHRDLTTPGVSGQYALDGSVGAIKHHISAGIDLDGQWIDDFKRDHDPIIFVQEGVNLVADQSITQKRVGGFLTERMEFGKQWSLLGSLRWDQIGNHLNDHLKLNGLDLSGNATFHRATGRAGISFNPRPEVGLYASWGQGFLPPATEELYANPDALGGFNKHLVPATSWGYEGGARGSLLSRLWYGVSIFHLETSNDFERYRKPERPLETFYGNAGYSSRNGMETEIRWMPITRLTISSAYTYSHFQYTSYTSQVYPGNLVGHWLPNSPNHQFYISGTAQFPRDLLLNVATQAYSRAFIDPTNAAHVDAYGLLNAHLSKRWQRNRESWRLFISGRNLTSTRYIAFTEPDPDGNSYQPGSLREVFGGIELRF